MVLFEPCNSWVSIQEPRIQENNHAQALPRPSLNREGQTLHKLNFSVIYHPRETLLNKPLRVLKEVRAAKERMWPKPGRPVLSGPGVQGDPE